MSQKNTEIAIVIERWQRVLSVPVLVIALAINFIAAVFAIINGYYGNLFPFTTDYSTSNHIMWTIIPAGIIVPFCVGIITVFLGLLSKHKIDLITKGLIMICVAAVIFIIIAYYIAMSFNGG